MSDCPGLDSGSLALGPKANLRLSPQSFDQTSLAHCPCSSPLVAGSLQARLDSDVVGGNDNDEKQPLSGCAGVAV